MWAKGKKLRAKVSRARACSQEQCSATKRLASLACKCTERTAAQMKARELGQYYSRLFPDAATLLGSVAAASCCCGAGLTGGGAIDMADALVPPPPPPQLLLLMLVMVLTQALGGSCRLGGRLGCGAWNAISSCGN